MGRKCRKKQLYSKCRQKMESLPVILGTGQPPRVRRGGCPQKPRSLGMFGIAIVWKSEENKRNF